MTETERRRDMIRELISRNEVQTQEQLRALLEAEGVETTQSTLSRDLREMNVLKRANAYQLPDPGLTSGGQARDLRRAIRDTVLDADRGHNLVVLRTEPGQEQMLMIKINEAHLPEALSAIAGHGTVWIATRTDTEAKSLLLAMRGIIGG